jgi:sarcosine oxidase subunit alpha
MVGEDGVVIDDGVTGRLDEDRYLMSTTSSGSERVRRWLEYWLQVEHPDWEVLLTPMTDAYAAMNVAGPRARDLLRNLVDEVDLDPAALPHMSVRTARVCAVPDCFMWRIGFTGELSYEVYVPASFGLYVWERLFAAGHDLGIRAFGVEAQRTMRIEKGHAVVGQDTDAQTGPFAVGLGRAVARDRPAGIGQKELEWQRANPDRMHRRLVGLQTVDGRVVPPESCQVLASGRVIGRITSSRYSPTLERSVSLALLEPMHATVGRTVDVRMTDGTTQPAMVLERTVQLDPDGERLHA